MKSTLIFFATLLSSITLFQATLFADSYYDYKNGKKYLCEEAADDSPRGSSCFCEEVVYSADRPEGCANIKLYQVKGTTTSEIESWWECTIPARKLALRSCEAAARSDTRCR